MTDKIKSVVASMVRAHFTEAEETQAFIQIIRDLNDGKWIKKEIMCQELIAYSVKVDRMINELAHALVFAQINHEAMASENKTYKDYYKSVSNAAKDVNEFLTEKGFRD